jgi:DNA-binding IclR family transcriptional regulator
MVSQDARSGLYDLGVTAVHLGMAAMRRLDVMALARPAMDTLCEQLREPVSLTIWGEGAPVIVHNVARHNSFPYELKLGSSAYATTTAAGRCFLAYMDANARNEVIARESRHLGPQAVPQKALAASLKLIREIGIAERHVVLAVREDIPPRHINIIAAPVFGSNNDVKAAITVLSQNASFDPSPHARPAQALLACARQLSAQLGHILTPLKEVR